MSVSRLFVEADLAAGLEAPLAEPQVHYLRHVMRRPDGAPLLLFNGRDGEWRGTFEGRGKKAAVARVDERLREQIAEPDVWLCFAPVKRARIDYIAEKATELGVAVLQPVLTHHTMVERVNLERLRANAIEAAEQTERLSVPEVRAPVALARLLGDWPAGRRLLMCDETGGGPPIAQALAGLEPAARVGALGDRDRTGGRLRRGRAGRDPSHKGCNGSGLGPSHPARRYGGPCRACLLAGAGRRLAAADTASGRRLPHI